jgi:hypothetical protein
MTTKYEIQEVECGLIAAGNTYQDTDNVVQDLDRCFVVTVDYTDYYFETLLGAKKWIRENT